MAPFQRNEQKDYYYIQSMLYRIRAMCFDPSVGGWVACHSQAKRGSSRISHKSFPEKFYAYRAYKTPGYTKIIWHIFKGDYPRLDRRRRRGGIRLARRLWG
jgi:hypothetical protein